MAVRNVCFPQDLSTKLLRISVLHLSILCLIVTVSFCQVDDHQFSMFQKANVWPGDAGPGNYSDNFEDKSYGMYSYDDEDYGYDSMSDDDEGRTLGGIVITGDPFVSFDLQILFPFSVDFGFPITQTFEIGRKKRDLISSTEDDHYAVLDHALHGPLHKVDALLYTLGVEDQSCVESSICLIHQKYEDYQPLSNLIEKILLIDRLGENLQTLNSTNSIRYHRYVHAVHQGQFRSSCPLPLSSCIRDVRSILYDPMFQFLQAADSIMSINVM